MMDSLYLAECPCNEVCAAVGSPDYMERATKETKAFINQLRRQFGNEPDGARLVVARNPHDFGTYLSVDVRFDSEKEIAVEYAYRLESNLPEKWDDEAKKELGIE